MKGEGKKNTFWRASFGIAMVGDLYDLRFGNGGDSDGLVVLRYRSDAGGMEGGSRSTKPKDTKIDQSDWFKNSLDF